ncbi:MAG TPA: type II 3-dehydroquinate dehydratase [Anaerolineales bacterium]|nr:type II 3-dehydroquinate dehydratase [Anaerolineales bacterium]
MKLLVLNGPNLNFLGKREPDIYGKRFLAEINSDLEIYAKERGIEIYFAQSNHEGILIDKLQEAVGQFDGVIFNPGGYTHTSVALRDAITSIPVPVIEVHLSNVFAREEFRHFSYLSGVCVGKISGFGENSYKLAINAFELMR